MLSVLVRTNEGGNPYACKKIRVRKVSSDIFSRLIFFSRRSLNGFKRDSLGQNRVSYCFSYSFPNVRVKFKRDRREVSKIPKSLQVKAFQQVSRSVVEIRHFSIKADKITAKAIF